MGGILHCFFCLAYRMLDNIRRKENLTDSGNVPGSGAVRSADALDMPAVRAKMNMAEGNTKLRVDEMMNINDSESEEDDEERGNLCGTCKERMKGDRVFCDMCNL